MVANDSQMFKALWRNGVAQSFRSRTLDLPPRVWPNQGLQPTPYSVRCASASRRGSYPAFGPQKKKGGDAPVVKRIGKKGRSEKRCAGRLRLC